MTYSVFALMVAMMCIGAPITVSTSLLWSGVTSRQAANELPDSERFAARSTSSRAPSRPAHA